MAERCHRGFSAGSGRRRGSSSTVDLENSLPSPPILWRSGKSVDFWGSSEAPGGPRRLPRGSQRSLEICDCLLVFRRFFGCGPRERDAQGGGGRLAVLPFPSPAFHLPLLLPSPPFPGQCGYGAILDSRHSYSKCPSGPQSSQIPTASRASSSTAAPSGPMCATGSSIGQGGSEREIRVQSNFRASE